ncbi:MAG: hypothetical protein JO053_15165 [Acidobacteria bacterium]|nr:hypothetical protein [Acidobacteriota bacterium]
MKNIAGICVLVLVVTGCDISKYVNTNQSSNNTNRSSSTNGQAPIDEPNRPHDTPTPASPGSDLPGTLRKLNGKYPSQSKLLDNSELQSRLKKIMGADFADLKKNFGTEMPIEIENNIFLAHACEPHNCGGNEYFIYFDLNGNNFNVYHIIDGRTKTYFEQSKINLPKKLSDEMNP